MANKQPNLQNRPGVVLLLALILMAAITASTIGISVLISSTLRQSRNLDNFIIASLAADSGLERGLAAVKVGRGPVVALSEVLTESGTSPPALTSSGASVNLTSVPDNQPISAATLAQNQTITFDLLKTTVNPPPYLLKVAGTCTASPCDSVLDVQWVVIDNDGNANYSGRRILDESNYESSVIVLDLRQVQSELSDSVSPFSGSGPLGYRIRVKALRGDVQNVEIVACNAVGGCGFCTTNPPSGSPVTCSSNATCSAASLGACNLSNLTDFTSRIRLTSTGEAGGLSERVRSVKTAGVLWQLPASSLLQYVIFSEQSLVP